MGKARNLSKLSSVLTTDGSVPAAKGGTGTTTGASGGSSGPKITAITVTDASYANLDDLAVDVLGGYIKITGTGFAAGCQVLVNTTTATSVTFISETEVRAQVPATTAGTYVVYLVNSDGGVAIRVNGISFSALPTWTSGSGLAGAVGTAISIQLTATGAATFALASGSSLPSGVTLSASGLISGTVTGISSETTYNFTVNATDSELQDSPRAFVLTVTVGDPYFKYNSLLLSANGTNLVQNNTFVDSSTNNFAVTRNGNTTQGTFSPYGANWSNYFDGNGDYLTVPANAAFGFGTGDFTIETWTYVTGIPTTAYVFDMRFGGGDLTALILNTVGSYTVYVNGETTSVTPATSYLNRWVHWAIVRSSGTVRVYVDGIQSATFAAAGSIITSGLALGARTNLVETLSGYISNFRVVKGTAVYTANFTPSTTPLTAITNTSLLTCQSNRFKDNSTNAFAITKTGDVSVQRFSPFNPTTAYSASTIGGSAYFDGTGDYLITPTDTAFNFGTGDFTIECWVYLTNSSATTQTIMGVDLSASTNSIQVWYNNTANKITFNVYGDPAFVSSSTVSINSWTHLAFTRASGTFKMFINGNQEASGSMTNNFANNKFVVGRGYATIDAEYFYGYLSNLRVIKGTAVYTANFIPSTAPVTAISGTSLLLNYTNAGIVDGTMQNNLETVSDAKISTTQSKFGGSSLSFDGTGDYLKSIATPSTNLSTGDFTIEFWVYPQGSGYYPCMLWWGNSSDNSYAQIYCSYDTVNQDIFLLCGSTAGGWLINTNGGAITPNAWQHIAIVRYGSAFTLYKNGVSTLTGTSSAALGPVAPTTNYIGARVNNTQYFTGYIDDLRITRGYARYTANFTPPTSAAQTQ